MLTYAHACIFAALMADPRKNELTNLFKSSTEEKKLGLAFIDDKVPCGLKLTVNEALS